MNVSQNPSLRELIETAAINRDSSVRRLTQLAQDEGFKVNHTTIGQLRNGSYKYGAPSTDTIRAIAWLAQVEDQIAFTAAGQPVPGPPLADELPPGSDNLSPKARKALIDMARLLVEYEAGNNAERTPLTQKLSRDSQPVYQQVNDDTDSRTLRAVAPTSDASQGQKTGAPDDIELMLDQLGVQQLHGEDARGYPASAKPLAAHHPFETEREKFEREHGKLGEDNQDTGEVE